MFCCLRTCLNGGNLRKPTTASHRFPEIHLDHTKCGPDVIILSNQLRITGTGGALTTAPLVQSKSYFEVKIQQAGSWSVGLATQQTDLSRKFGGGDKESWCLCSDNATRHNDEVLQPVVVLTAAPTANGVNGFLNGNASASAAAAAAGLIGIEDDVADDLLLTTGSSTPVPAASISLDSVATADDAVPPERVFPDEGDIVGVAFDHVELNFYYNGKNLEVPYRNVKGDVYPVVYVGNGAILDIILDNFNYGPPPGFDKIMLEQSLL